jgi:hypothetical protein
MSEVVVLRHSRDLRQALKVDEQSTRIAGSITATDPATVAPR